MKRVPRPVNNKLTASGYCDKHLLSNPDEEEIKKFGFWNAKYPAVNPKATFTTIRLSEEVSPQPACLLLQNNIHKQ
ncbi:hypothetical protein ACTXT7_010855 [Hymenolepis weldensis]